MSVVAALAEAGFTPTAVCPLTPQEAEIYGGPQALLLSPSADLWHHVVRHSPSAPSLDQYSSAALTDIAQTHALRAAFPFERSPNGAYVPFYEWALRSGSCFTSPIGMLVHDRFGLMISFRGALIGDGFDPRPGPSASPCHTCVDTPCLHSCPVGALGPHAYDVAACRDALCSDDLGHCMTLACKARRSCPHTPAEMRPAAHIAHLMREFANAASH